MIPLARNFHPFRKPTVHRIIRSIAKENALFCLATAIPDVVPSLASIPWAFGEFTSDTAFLTMNLARHINAHMAQFRALTLGDQDAVAAHRHLQMARALMRRESEGVTTERGTVGRLAQLSTELDVFLTVERAVPSLPAGSLGLPMVLERKGYGLDAKTATVTALASNPARLNEYRTLLARRAALARTPANATAATADEPGQRTRLAQEMDRQIQVLELEASQPTLRDAFASVRTRVKICGITRHEDAAAAVAAGLEARHDD